MRCVSLAEPLDAGWLRSALAGCVATFELHTELESTNKRAAAIGAVVPLPAVIIGECQRAGRGRHQRMWLSAAERSLTFSVAIAVDAVAVAGLSLAVATGVAQVLRDCGVQAYLKWPNDILGPTGGKLAGILVEIFGQARIAVLGVGINLLPFAALRALPVRTDWVQAHVDDVRRNDLLVALVRGLLDAVTTWRTIGFVPIRQDWLRLAVHKPGDVMRVCGPDRQYRMLTFVDLGPAGELITRDAAGQIHELASAEVDTDVLSD